MSPGLGNAAAGNFGLVAISENSSYCPTSWPVLFKNTDRAGPFLVIHCASVAAARRGSTCQGTESFSAPAVRVM